MASRGERLLRPHLAMAGVLVALGCAGGEPSETSGAAGSAGPPGAPSLPYAEPAPVLSPIAARTWKLSHAEYARAVEDFLGVNADSSGFESELDNGVYPNMAGSGLVRATLARDYYESADRIAAGLTEAQLRALVAGRPLAAAEKAAFIEVAVRRAFRRPATSDDRAAYSEIFELGASESPEPSAPFRAVLRALLSSPHFLYRTELGDGASASFELTGFEAASLLSFSLLGRPPSPSLVEAAERGELNEPVQLAQHVGALLETEDASLVLQRFMLQWLQIHHWDDIDKDERLFSGFTASKPLMWAEARGFIAQQGDLLGTLPAILTQPVLPPFELASYYGSDPSARGDPGARSGVLGLGAVIARTRRPTPARPPCAACSSVSAGSARRSTCLRG